MSQRWRLAILPVVLAGVALVTFHPHANPLTGDTRVFPIHMDEYVHWGEAVSIQREARVDATNIYSAGDAQFALQAENHERGFHIYLAAFQEATGIPWTTLFAGGPVLVALLGALAVFALAERWGAGLEAALWLAAVPTTLRFLGPGFLVPIALTIPILAFGLHLLFHTTGFRTYIAIALISAGLWPIHAFGAVLLLGFCLLMGLASLHTPSRAAALVGTAAGPALIAYPYYARVLRAPHEVSTLPPNIATIHLAGAILFALALLGIVVLCLRRTSLGAAIVLGVTLLAGEVLLARRVEANEDLFGLYDRTFTLLPFLAAVPAGVGTAAIWRGLARLAPLRRYAVPLAVAILVLQASVVGARAKEQMAQDYYEVVTEEQFADYLEALPHLQGPHRLAIVDGQTMPFTLATGIPTLYVFLPLSGDPPEVVSRFFADGASDTIFLLHSGTSIVVTQRPVQNPYLVQVSDSVYVLRPDVAVRLQ